MVFENPANGRRLVAIADVSVAVHEDEFVAVVGPSGCGKTTLLRLMAGLLEPTSGRITVAGADVRRGKHELGFVFQNASLYPWRTVAENVAFGKELKVRSGRHTWPWSRTRLRKQVLPLLDLVGLADFADYLPHEISGGMQQRANLARALAIEPRVLLMDEPFGALDAQTREGLQIELQRIVLESKSSVLFITHDIREAVYLADRVVVLSQRPSEVVAEVTIPTPRPRPADYQVSTKYNDLVREVWMGVHGRPIGAEERTGAWSG